LWAIRALKIADPRVEFMERYRVVFKTLRFWFGFEAPVGRIAYAISGFGLMAAK
jgi:hypothetical protein